MRNYSNWFQQGSSAASPRMSRMHEHVADAFTFLHKVSEVRDLHDLVRVHAEFMQKKVNMLTGHAKEFTHVTAAAGNILGAFVSLLQARKQSEDIARNSPTYKPADEDGPIRTFRAKT
jgi:hypothetical protein